MKKIFLILLIILGCFGTPSVQARADDTTLSSSVNWNDRRPIGTLFVRSFENKSGFLGDDNDPVKALNTYADQWSIPVLKDLHAQGMILWDLGTKFALPGGYEGCPEIVTTSRPELAKAIPLFFKKYRDAGILTGCTIRPELWNPEKNRIEPAADPYEALLLHIRYAHRYWGCRIFYVDTNFYAAPNVWPPQYLSILSPAIYERLTKAVPGILIIPEHHRVWGNGSVDLGQYQRVAPYMELRHGDLGTLQSVRTVVPKAFSVLMVTEGDTDGNFDTLVNSAKAGDIFLVAGWWRSKWFDDVIKIRKAAGLMN